MIINKNVAINAVLTEPLRIYNWNRDNNEHCEVCAVGSIFRQYGVNNEDIIHEYIDGNYEFSDDATTEDIELSLKDKRYLEALSGFHESRFENTDLEEHRLQLAMFIETHFPDNFEIKGV